MESLTEELFKDDNSFISNAPEDIIVEKDDDNEFDYKKFKIHEKGLPIFDKRDNAKLFKIENKLMYPLDDKFAKMTPYELFLFFFSDLCKEIASYSTKFALENNRKETFEEKDILLYLLVYIYLSVYNLPEIGMLWENSILFKSVIPGIISKCKYTTVNQFFTLSSLTKKEESEKAEKILHIIDYLNKKWKESYPYTRYLSIDEAMTSYKGSICFKQYMKDKHKRFGIKLFSKAAADRGYCYHMLLYTGKNFEYDKKWGIGPTVIKELTKDQLNQNYHFTFDNYFSNLYTFSHMEQNKLQFTCTFSVYKSAIPDKIKRLNLKKGEMKCYELEDTKVKMFIYHNRKKQIQLASNCCDIQFCTYYNKSKKKHVKHEIIANYNLTKAGVDLIDSATQIYKTQRKTNKWWKAVFFYLLDVTLNNCVIIYNTSDKFHKITDKNRALLFRKILINQFLEIYKAKEIKVTQRLVREYHLLVDTEMKVQSCFNCKQNHTPIGRNYKRSKFKCDKCNVVLCKECFIKVHVRMNTYRKSIY